MLNICLKVYAMKVQSINTTGTGTLADVTTYFEVKIKPCLFLTLILNF